MVSNALDMTRGKDREYLVRAITSGWPIDQKDLAIWYGMLQWAAQEARKNNNLRELNSCVRTAVVIVGQIQSDQQLAEKYSRVDAGDPTERVEHGGALKIIEGVPEDAV